MPRVFIRQHAPARGFDRGVDECTGYDCESAVGKLGMGKLGKLGTRDYRRFAANYDIRVTAVLRNDELSELDKKTDGNEFFRTDRTAPSLTGAPPPSPATVPE